MAPAPVNKALFLFLTFAAGVIGWFWAMVKRGNLSKDNFQVVCVVVTTLTYFLALIYVCAWMHQWHPLLKPEWAGE